MIIDLFHNYYLDMSMGIYCTSIIVNFYGESCYSFLYARIMQLYILIVYMYILKVYGMCVGHTS